MGITHGGIENGSASGGGVVFFANIPVKRENRYSPQLGEQLSALRYVEDAWRGADAAGTPGQHDLPGAGQDQDRLGDGAATVSIDQGQLGSAALVSPGSPAAIPESPDDREDGDGLPAGIPTKLV